MRGDCFMVDTLPMIRYRSDKGWCRLVPHYHEAIGAFIWIEMAPGDVQSFTRKTQNEEGFSYTLTVFRCHAETAEVTRSFGFEGSDPDGHIATSETHVLDRTTNAWIKTGGEFRDYRHEGAG